MGSGGAEASHWASDLTAASTLLVYPPAMLGVSLFRVSPALYRHTWIFFGPMAHPICVTPLHTIGVKCPTTPVLPLLQPGNGPQFCTSPYQAVTTASIELWPMPRFSPAGPSGEARL